MKHTHFRISNFRGIAEMEFSLEASPKTSVFTLVGLNESGKTTILEAINSFSGRIDLDPLNLPGYRTRDAHELIPINQRSNFNGKISVKVGFVCDEEDEKAIRQFARSKCGIALSEPVGRFVVEQSYHFKSSALVPSQTRNQWTIQLVGRKKGERKDRPIGFTTEEWQKIVSYIRSDLLPSVVYFPNFLFELPDRIYLEPDGVEDDKHEFYRDVLQDVLDAIGEQTNIKEHILNRAKSGSIHDKKSLDSVLLKMGSHITETVFSSWNRIFKRTSSGKEILVSIDQDDKGRWFLQLRLKDRSDLYSISERSLGFRWFFAFLLLTQYRGSRKTGPQGALFLFDEPASNLHPSAQAQLLESFGRFPAHAPIIYTTHSHHMVNPNWLEGTFVVKNEGLDYDKPSDEYSARKTLITLHRYRSFATAHPNQATYLQPILDVLAYQPSKLENVPSAVMVEGKNDFYSLRLMESQLSERSGLHLIPGTGAGTLAEVLRLYIGWGRTFLVVLDDDKEGRRQKTRYEDLFGRLVEGRVLTLADIDNEWRGLTMEDLFDPAERLAIQRQAYPEAEKYQKILFNRAVQELLVTNQRALISSNTEKKFAKLFGALETLMDT